MPDDTHAPPDAACCRVLSGADRVNPATAVCVGQRDGHAYLLSAAHALPPDQAQTFQFFTGGPKPTRELRGGDILLRRADPDLVLVKLPVDGPPLPELPLAGRSRRLKPLPVAGGAVGCAGGAPPAGKPVVVLARRLVRRPGGGLAFFWETETAPVPGMSGGPLLDPGGAVIGVCSAAALDSGRGYYTHLDEVQAAVTEAGCGWLLDPPTKRRG